MGESFESALAKQDDKEEQLAERPVRTRWSRRDFSFFFSSSAAAFMLGSSVGAGVSGCGGKSKSEDEKPSLDNPRFYFGTMTSFAIDIYYEANAAPIGLNNWGLLKANLNALFRERTIRPVITLPSSQSEWNLIPEQNKNSWSLEALVELERNVRKRRSEGTAGNFFVVFLDGYLEEEGAAKETVIGVSLTGTTIIAMFKPVIESTGGPRAVNVPQFVEQSTIVHELGHALGLVNNGVTPQSAHQDSENGAHCTNADCVMYWLNEGRDAAIEFRKKYLATGDPVIFGPECLEDVKLFMV